MNRDYPALRAPDYGPDAAGELLRGGRVALFLDGLDEMPDGVREQALKRVDEEARGLRVVITSRPAEYRHACRPGVRIIPQSSSCARSGPSGRRLPAARAGRAQPPAMGAVGAYLKRNPGSVAARALDNPLTLSLARDTYTNQDPVRLC